MLEHLEIVVGKEEGAQMGNDMITFTENKGMIPRRVQGGECKRRNRFEKEKREKKYFETFSEVG